MVLSQRGVVRNEPVRETTVGELIEEQADGISMNVLIKDDHVRVERGDRISQR